MGEVVGSDEVGDLVGEVVGDVVGEIVGEVVGSDVVGDLVGEPVCITQFTTVTGKSNSLVNSLSPPQAEPKNILRPTV